MRIIDNTRYMQQGGALPPLAIYDPVPQPMMPTSPSTSATASEQPASLIDDYTMKMLTENGLPSDVEYFYSAINQMSNSIFTNPFDTSSINQKMNMAGRLLNRIHFNNREFERVMKNAETRGGISEIAINNRGQLVGMDEDQNIRFLTPKEYEENQDKIQLLTNGDLAQLRATQPGMAFNTDVFNIIDNGIGINKVTQMLWDTITKLDEDSISSDMFTTRNGQILSGINQLLQEGPDGVYKVTSKETGQNRQAMAALNYLYATLPTNAKALLQAKAIQQGYNADDGAKILIGQLITSGTGFTSETNLDYDSTASSAAGPGSSGTNEEISPFAQFLNGDTNDVREITIYGKNNHQMTTIARNFNNLLLKDNTPAPRQDNLLHLMDTTALTNGDRSSISISGNLITEAQADGIMADLNQGGVSQVYLPYQKVGNSYVPDFDLANRIKEIEDTMQGATPMDIDKAFKDAKIEVTRTADGRYVPKKVKLFYVLTGYGTEAQGFNPENHGIRELSDVVGDAEEHYKDIAARIREEHTGNNKNESHSSMTLGRNHYWFGIDTKTYVGDIYIAASDDKTSAAAVQQKYTVPKNTFDLNYQLNRGEAARNIGTQIIRNFE